MIMAGQLRERIRFERRPPQSNSAGVVRANLWAHVAGPVSARIKPIRAGEEVMAQRLGGTAVVEITVRGSSDIRGVRISDRAVDARDPSRTWNITAIEDVSERGLEYRITAQSGGSDG